MYLWKHLKPQIESNLDGFEVTIANPAIDEVRGYPNENPRDYGNDKGVEIPVRDKGTKEIATNRIDNSVANNTHNSHEATQISSNLRTVDDASDNNWDVG